MSMKLCRSRLVSNKVYENRQHDIDAMKLQARCCSSTHQHYSRSSLVKNSGTWAAGCSNPNLVMRRGSTIFRKGRLGYNYGWFSLVYGWGSDINYVMYPSCFNAICRVRCTEAEMCGVDSSLDQTCHWSESRSQHGNCSWKTATHKNNNTIKMKNKRTNVNMQAQEVSRGRRWDQKNFLTALADQWFQPKWRQHVTSRACATGQFLVPRTAPLLGRYNIAPALLHKSCHGNHGFLWVNLTASVAT